MRKQLYHHLVHVYVEWGLKADLFVGQTAGMFNSGGFVAEGGGGGLILINCCILSTILNRKTPGF